jgi:hypothetical protein
MVTRICLDDKLKDAYNLLSSLAEGAYKDIYMLSSPVLSKNPRSSNFLKDFLADKDVGAYPFHKAVCKLAKYYLCSIFHFMRYIARYVIHRVNGMEFDIRSDQSELIIVDTFFLCDKILQSDRYNELYFQGLDCVLDAAGKNYAYLPVFYGCKHLNMFHRILKILKRDQVSILSEYQLLNKMDLLKLFMFIVAYPWHVLNFSVKLNGTDQATEIAGQEMIKTLDQVTFYNYSRYLQGRRIAQLPYKKIKMISWFENQVIDKNLYKGLKSNGNKVTIYGAQLLLYSKMDLNILVDENEEKFGIIPDRIIVNGPFFVPESSGLHYVTGPSLRYYDLFRTSVQKGRQRDILVLLSHSAEDTENILQMLTELNLSSRHVVIKAHPATPIDEFKHLVHPGWSIAKEGTYKLFETAKMVIGSASGSLVEAASLGIPVIRIVNRRGLDYSYLPELGKGILWDEAGDAEELMNQVEKYENIPDHDLERMAALSTIYKDMFFCEPTQEKIIEAFDLK